MPDKGGRMQERKEIRERGCMYNTKRFATYIYRHQGMSMREDELCRKEMHGQDAAELKKRRLYY